MAACVAAWGAKTAVGQVADEPRAGAASNGQSLVVEVETADPNGIRRRVPLTLSHENYELQKFKQQEAELAQQSQSLVKKLAETEDDAERTGLVNELEETISKQFDVQQQVRELELSRIEAKVKKLRETITKRSNARAAIVRNRREQLLQEAEGLGWNSPEHSHAGGAGVFYQPARVVRPGSAARLP
ncbi:MAG TPA: hypothetical protein VFW87_23500 [Pirellulales bacterium]|nr:hypothetical protein [Pirellulales bacterium]